MSDFSPPPPPPDGVALPNGPPPLPSFNSLYINNCVAGGLGVMLNLFLLAIIRYGSPPEMKSYKLFLYANCIVDGCYALATLLTQTVPKRDPLTKILAMVPLGPIQLFDSWIANAVAICIYSLLNLSTQMTLPFTYIFRYFLICRQMQMTGHRFAWMILAMMGFNLIYAILFYLVFGIKPLPSDLFDREIDALAIVRNPNGHYNYVAASSENPMSSILAYYPLGVIGLLYILTIVTAIMTHRYVSVNRDQMNKNTAKMQSQLSWTLSMQTFLPIIIMLLPFVLNFVLVRLLHFDAGNSALIALMSQCWIPIGNPIIAMAFVGPYRWVIKRICCCQMITVSNVWTSSKNVQSIADPQMGPPGKRQGQNQRQAAGGSGARVVRLETVD